MVGVVNPLEPQLTWPLRSAAAETIAALRGTQQAGTSEVFANYFSCLAALVRKF